MPGRQLNDGSSANPDSHTHTDRQTAPTFSSATNLAFSSVHISKQPLLPTLSIVPNAPLAKDTGLSPPKLQQKRKHEGGTGAAGRPASQPVKGAFAAETRETLGHGTKRRSNSGIFLGLRVENYSV